MEALTQILETAIAYLQANPGAIVVAMLGLAFFGLVELGAQQLAWARAYSRRNEPQQIDLTQFTIK